MRRSRNIGMTGKSSEREFLALLNLDEADYILKRYPENSREVHLVNEWLQKEYATDSIKQAKDAQTVVMHEKLDTLNTTLKTTSAIPNKIIEYIILMVIGGLLTSFWKFIWPIIMSLLNELPHP